MEEKDLRRILHQDLSAGTDAFRDGLLMRCLKEVNASAPDVIELVYNYVRYRMPGDEAEDIVSEAYLLAARNFYRFDPSRAKFSTWVIHIAINCMNSHWRKRSETVDLEEVPPQMLSVSSGEDAVDDSELVDRLLGVLDEREREVVLLKYRDDLRNTEIARVMDMNPSTVSTVLSRALAKMRVVAERNS